MSAKRTHLSQSTPGVVMEPFCFPRERWNEWEPGECETNPFGPVDPPEAGGGQRKKLDDQSQFLCHPARGKRLPESGRLEKAIQLRKIAERSQLSWGCPAWYGTMRALAGRC